HVDGGRRRRDAQDSSRLYRSSHGHALGSRVDGGLGPCVVVAFCWLPRPRPPLRHSSGSRAVGTALRAAIRSPSRPRTSFSIFPRTCTAIPEHRPNGGGTPAP